MKKQNEKTKGLEIAAKSCLSKYKQEQGLGSNYYDKHYQTLINGEKAAGRSIYAYLLGKEEKPDMFDAAVGLCLFYLKKSRPSKISRNTITVEEYITAIKNLHSKDRKYHCTASQLIAIANEAEKYGRKDHHKMALNALIEIIENEENIETVHFIAKGDPFFAIGIIDILQQYTNLIR